MPSTNSILFLVLTTAKRERERERERVMHLVQGHKWTNWSAASVEDTGIILKQRKRNLGVSYIYIIGMRSSQLFTFPGSFSFVANYISWSLYIYIEGYWIKMYLDEHTKRNDRDHVVVRSDWGAVSTSLPSEKKEEIDAYLYISIYVSIPSLFNSDVSVGTYYFPISWSCLGRSIRSESFITWFYPQKREIEQDFFFRWVYACMCMPCCTCIKRVVTFSFFCFLPNWIFLFLSFLPRVHLSNFFWYVVRYRMRLVVS